MCIHIYIHTYIYIYIIVIIRIYHRWNLGFVSLKIQLPMSMQSDLRARTPSAAECDSASRYSQVAQSLEILCMAAVLEMRLGAHCKPQLAQQINASWCHWMPQESSVVDVKHGTDGSDGKITLNLCSLRGIQGVVSYGIFTFWTSLPNLETHWQCV